mgnify:CR=1 FL=1
MRRRCIVRAYDPRNHTLVDAGLAPRLFWRESSARLEAVLLSARSPLVYFVAERRAAVSPKDGEQ